MGYTSQLPRPLSPASQNILDSLPLFNPNTGDRFGFDITTINVNTQRQDPAYRLDGSLPSTGDYTENDIRNDLMTRPRPGQDPTSPEIQAQQQVAQQAARLSNPFASNLENRKSKYVNRSKLEKSSRSTSSVSSDNTSLSTETTGKERKSSNAKIKKREQSRLSYIKTDQGGKEKNLARANVNEKVHQDDGQKVHH